MNSLSNYLTPLSNSDEQREKIEWSNVWIDKPADRNSPRLLMIGDSVLRMVRSRVAASTNCPTDFIGCSSSLNDVLFAGLVDYFFQTVNLKYAGVVIQYNHHGTKNADGEEYADKDYRLYHDNVSKLVEFVQQRTSNIVLVNLLDFYHIKPHFTRFIPKAILRTLYGWSILKEEKDEYRTHINHRRNMELRQVAQEHNVKFLDLNSTIANHKLIRTDNIHPEAKAIPIMADAIIWQARQ